jgi:hypothetical protein
MFALNPLAQKNNLEKRINKFEKTVNAIKHDHLKKHILSYEPMVKGMLVSNKYKVTK